MVRLQLKKKKKEKKGNQINSVALPFEHSMI